MLALWPEQRLIAWGVLILGAILVIRPFVLWAIERASGPSAPIEKVQPRASRIPWGAFVIGTSVIIAALVVNHRTAPVKRAHISMSLSIVYKPDIFREGSDLAFNVTSKNVGDGSVTKSWAASRSFIQNDISDLSATLSIDEFYKWIDLIPKTNVDKALHPSDERFNTARGPILSADDVEHLKSKARVAYVVSVVMFEDSTGRYTQEKCAALQTPVFGAAVWKNCGTHNSERSGWATGDQH